MRTGKSSEVFSTDLDISVSLGLPFTVFPINIPIKKLSHHKVNLIFVPEHQTINDNERADECPVNESAQDETMGCND